MTADQIRRGARVFLDSTIFVYHFSGASEECRHLLMRCEHGELKGMTNALVLAETARRLMTLEAVSSGAVTGGNVVKKLRARPDLVRSLSRHAEALESIPLMGVEVLPVTLALLLGSSAVRKRTGLLVNDSLVLAAALDAEADVLATADADFEATGGKPALFRPGDLSRG